MILMSWTDFKRVWSILLIFNLILHVLYILTRKIVRFYESKCVFDNID
jgi:hypothetical protein